MCEVFRRMAVYLLFKSIMLLIIINCYCCRGETSAQLQRGGIHAAVPESRAGRHVRSRRAHQVPRCRPLQGRRRAEQERPVGPRRLPERRPRHRRDHRARWCEPDGGRHPCDGHDRGTRREWRDPAGRLARHEESPRSLTGVRRRPLRGGLFSLVIKSHDSLFLPVSFLASLVPPQTIATSTSVQNITTRIG